MSVFYSIITVCLNDRTGLRKTADSIQQQTNRDFEWIIIDGDSNDGSVDIVRDHPLVTHLVSEPDEGIYDAMNKGIRLAKGDYCLFLNAGDWFYSETVLEKILPSLHGDLVIGWIHVIYPPKWNKTPRIKRLDNQDVRSKYLYHLPPPHQATFIRRQLFEKYGLYDQNFKIYADWDFVVRVFRSGGSIGFAKLCVANYTMDGISSEKIHSEEANREICIMRKKNFSIIYRIMRTIVDFVEKMIGVRGY